MAYYIDRFQDGPVEASMDYDDLISEDGNKTSRFMTKYDVWVHRYTRQEFDKAGQSFDNLHKNRRRPSEFMRTMSFLGNDFAEDDYHHDMLNKLDNLENYELDAARNIFIIMEIGPRFADFIYDDPDGVMHEDTSEDDMYEIFKNQYYKEFNTASEIFDRSSR